jgi:hypothetical protein
MQSGCCLRSCAFAAASLQGMHGRESEPEEIGTTLAAERAEL